MTPFQNDDELEKLRVENELKKMKLILEHGAIISDQQGEKPIHPEIENQFLNSIQAFEDNFENAQLIKVYDFIERPDFIPVDAIADQQISTELKSVMNILNENGISLDTICEVEEREIYRFVTEELFNYEMDNVRIPGMVNCFIYEDFHPNVEYDIKNAAEEGVASFLNKDAAYYEHLFTMEVLEEPWFKNYRDAFGSFVIKFFEIISHDINGINASVKFTIDYTGIIEGSSDTQHCAGEGSVEFLYQYGYWYIQMINLPDPSWFVSEHYS